MDQEFNRGHDLNHNPRSPKRLTKQPPPSSTIYSRMSQGAATQLRRHPSAPQSPSSTTNYHDHHHRTQSSHASPTSSVERSPNPSVSKYSSQLQSQSEASLNRDRHSARLSVTEKSSDDFELIDMPSELPGDLSTFDPAKAPSYQNALRRPGPLPLSHSSPGEQMTSPSLRQSASFSAGDRHVDSAPPLPDSGSATPKRYSDEAKNAAPWKKKGSFSSFMNSVLGSPRNVKISNPENPVHVTHVGFDNKTGQFTVSLSSPCHLYCLVIPPSCLCGKELVRCLVGSFVYHAYLGSVANIFFF